MTNTATNDGVPAKLDLDSLTEVGTSANAQEETGTSEKKEPVTAFDSLVLPDGHKKMVLSLIAQHFRDKESPTGQSEQDIVRGKGRLLSICRCKKAEDR